MGKNLIDTIIIGCGNAGLEAALILKKLKKNILIITNNIDNIGILSCNPSIGGIGKSNLIKEIDLLGGVIGKISDKSLIQKKILNFSKGESINSLRLQLDRNLYKNKVLKIIKIYNLKIKQDVVEKLIIKNYKVIGVLTKYKNKFYSKNIIITTGTFLNSKIYIGKNLYKGGRLNDISSNFLSNQMENIGFERNRLKTGTPPRINNKINFNKLIKQKSDTNIFLNNFSNNKYKDFKKFSCWLTKTNEKTHDIIKKNLKKSPIYNNLINGVGPRYCPSIEDKIYRFYNKKSHQIFLEPENKNFTEFYPNGISTSLPYKIQKFIINSIKGLEKTSITRPGYTVEYDFFNPKNLKTSLESKSIEGLFLAGQINGTTGYEEAASQGIVAGINSNFKIIEKKQWLPNKNNSYIGLLINDITKKGVKEPYRILSNKPNLKINIRNDNIFLRLTKYFKKNINKFVFLNEIKLKSIFIYKLNNFYKIIKKKNFYNFIIKLKNINENKKLIKKINKKLNIYFKYINYVKIEFKKFKNFKNINIKINKINYFKIKNISKEVSEKLNKYKPKNIKDIFKIPNINNKSILNIINYFKKFN